MDAFTKKRKVSLATKGASSTAKKLKIQSRSSGLKSKSKAQRPKRAIPADALSWRAVDIPDMLEDAEGFFGLEEVHGVDVVRNGDIIQFLATDAPESEDEAFSGFDDTTTTATTSKDVDEPDAIEQEPEAAADTTEAPSKNTTAKGATKKDLKTKDPKVKSLKAAKKLPAPEDDQLESHVFSALEDSTQEPEEEVDMSAWEPLELSTLLMSSLSRLRFAKPSLIQERAIPHIMAGHDVIGKASTGSGKTLAFAIPIVEAWLAQQQQREDEDTRLPISLVMSPTRELAHQLTNHIQALCAGLEKRPYICSVTGGLSVHKQQRQLEKADIVVGTPGRLWEVMSGSSSLLESLKSIKFLVVDEADRLLTEGHFKEVKQILDALDRHVIEDDEDEPTKVDRQTLVFSATFNQGLQQKLAGKGRFDLMSETQSMEYLLKKLNFKEAKPKFIDVNPVSHMAHGLKEGLVECGAMEKDLYLYALLLMQSTQRSLVFTNSISAVRRLIPMFQALNLPIHALHSQMAQKARLRSVERFTAAQAGTPSMLLATDVAARGLDIPGIDTVIHYHVPRTADAYVHRSGRTARAEQAGLSILLCAPEEVVSTRRLVAKVHASTSASEPAKVTKRKTDFYIRTIDLDRKLVARLKERVTLAKKIADSGLAKERGNKDDTWMRQAADDLGVVFDSSDEEQKAGKWGGRGSGRKAKEEEARGISKAELGAMRAQLRELLSKRINTGVSERYVAAEGRVDLEQLMKGVDTGFLGSIDGLGMDD